MDEMDEQRERWVSLRPDAAGRYAWDRWETEALSAGVDPELAALGREIILRARYWSADQREDGQLMLSLALRDPVGARVQWKNLLFRMD